MQRQKLDMRLSSAATNDRDAARDLQDSIMRFRGRVVEPLGLHPDVPEERELWEYLSLAFAELDELVKRVDRDLEQ